MISEELLSEVLGRNVSKVSIPVIENSIHIEFDDVFSTFINIYELAYKCKEWAIEQGYELNSYIRFTNVKFARSYCEIYVKYKKVNDIKASTESDAIFKACQWIKEQHDN